MSTPERFALAITPTPLQHAPRLQRALRTGPLWVKRDDLTGFAAAGNKARPLEYLIGDALAQHADRILACGSPGSNFCAAAALAARAAGLDCELLHPGPRPDPATTTMRLAEAAGAELRFDPALRREDLDDAVTARAAALRAAGHHPYPLPRGGATAVGATGFARAAGELADQCARAGLTRATVVLPTGSGASQAGLVAGLGATTVPLRVLGVCVSRPAAGMAARILRLARECAALLGLPTPGEADVHVVDGIGPGFKKASAADRSTARAALTSAGLLLDDTYGAKTLSAVRQLGDDRGDPVIFWYTGGVPAALQTVGMS